MAIPPSWDIRYRIVNHTTYQMSSARGLCPHCQNASTFVSHFIWQETDSSRKKLYMILTCNHAPCSEVVYVITSITNGRLEHDPKDDFFIHPSGKIDKPHPGIPAQIADDWIEAQKAIQVSAPKATAVMLRRVLYGVLMDKSCKLKPLKDGVKELIAKERLPKMFDDWLIAIHDDGHDGAHPDRALQVSAENVSETIEYTSELLRYLYIEPYEFEQRKKRNTAPATTTS